VIGKISPTSSRAAPREGPVQTTPLASTSMASTESLGSPPPLVSVSMIWSPGPR
jgi:hypothetical protein